MNAMRCTATAAPAFTGDNQADRLTALFDAHNDRLYRLARRLLPTQDDALDLVQETFLKAARSPKSVPIGHRNEEAWLVRVLINIRRDQWRRQKVRGSQIEISTQRPAYGVNASHPENALVTKAIVWQALDRLSPRRRAIVVMYELDGMGISDISILLGITVVTIRWHLSLGRRELVKALRPHMEERNENR